MDPQIKNTVQDAPEHLPIQLQTDLTYPISTSAEPIPKGSFTDTCLVCNKLCVVTEPDSKIDGKSLYKTSSPQLSQDIRRAFYRAFDIGIDPSEVFKGTEENGIQPMDLPLCAYCMFKCGQIKTIQSQLLALEREYQRLREEIAFSIVDIVASNTGELPDLSKHSKAQFLSRLRSYEVETLQQFVFDRWCEASYSDFNSVEPGPDSSQFEKRSTSSSTPKLKPIIKNNLQQSQSTPVPVNQTTVGISEDQQGDDYEEPGTSVVEKQKLLRKHFQNMETETGCTNEEAENSIHHEEDTGSGNSFPFSLGIANFNKSFDGNMEDDDGDGSHGNEYADDLGVEDDGILNDEQRRRRRTSDFTEQSLDLCKNHEGLYACMFCEKTFLHKYPFRDHLKTHTGEGPRCPVCSKIFPKAHNLMLHLRTHTGEKPYNCNICKKGFADKSNLKVHMRVHTGERPYQCDYCNMAFVNSSRLVVHRRQHTGEKFTCDHCPKAFSTTNQLSAHRKVHTESKVKQHRAERPYSCTECCKTFTNQTVLSSHLGLYHGI